MARVSQVTGNPLCANIMLNELDHKLKRSQCHAALVAFLRDFLTAPLGENYRVAASITIRPLPFTVA